ncbi:MAG: phage integrase N-terminal SAM-like domain-containing protein, partial [archaeon]
MINVGSEVKEREIERMLCNTSMLEKDKITRKDTKIMPEHLGVLREFDKYNILRNMAVGTRRTYLHYMRSFCLSVKKPFKDVTRENIETYLISIKDRPEQSKSIIKSVLKLFFKWFYKTGDKKYPEIVDWITTTVKSTRKKLPEELLTPKEVLKMANATDNLKDKALIMVLYES